LFAVDFIDRFASQTVLISARYLSRAQRVSVFQSTSVRVVSLRMICLFFSLIARFRPRRVLTNLFIDSFFFYISTRLFVVLQIEIVNASAESNQTINVHVDRKHHLVPPNVPRL